MTGPDDRERVRAAMEAVEAQWASQPAPPPMQAWLFVGGPWNGQVHQVAVGRHSWLVPGPAPQPVMTGEGPGPMDDDSHVYAYRLTLCQTSGISGWPARFYVMALADTTDSELDRTVNRALADGVIASPMFFAGQQR